MSDKEPEWNTDLDQAPYGEVLEVTNDLMDEPVLATRGYCLSDGTVHADQSFFTGLGSWCSKPGQLVIPNRWRKKA